MNKINHPWSFATRLPVWTSAVVTRLKRLDAADAAAGQQALDGRYLGVDLASFAKRYAARSSRESVSTYFRLFLATEALRSYSKHPSADALGRAMFEGARAMLEGRAPQYAQVEGFAARFIDVDFVTMVDDIARGNRPVDVRDWHDYWSRWLGGCWPDLFKTKYPCDGCPCEFP